MDLLDSYLHAVKLFLPNRQQDDIIRELGEEIRSEMEEKEASLGRPLTDSEREDVITRYGHPAALASRYAPGRHLIGPELFPFYSLILKIAVTCAIVIHVAVAVVIVASGGNALRVLTGVSGLPVVLLIQFAVITLIFAALDHYKALTRSRRRWTARDLHASRLASPTETHSTAEIVAGAAFLVWWLAGPRSPYLLLGPAAKFLVLAPAWRAMYWPVAVIAFVALVEQVMGRLRPDWRRTSAALRLFTGAAGFGVLCVLLRSGEFATLSPSVAQSARTSDVLAVVNMMALIGLTIAAMIVAILVLFRIRLVFASNVWPQRAAGLVLLLVLLAAPLHGQSQPFDGCRRGAVSPAMRQDPFSGKRDLTNTWWPSSPVHGCSPTARCTFLFRRPKR